MSTESKSNWETWSMPQRDPATGTWFFKHLTADAKLIKLYDGYATEDEAKAAHREAVINAVLAGEQQ